MAAEHETTISLYFKMTAAVLWRNELKIEHGEDYEETKNRLFAIPRMAGPGQPRKPVLGIVRSRLVSQVLHFKICV